MRLQVTFDEFPIGQRFAVAAASAGPGPERDKPARDRDELCFFFFCPATHVPVERGGRGRG